MSSGDLDRLETLFLAASELPPEEREAFLDAECGEDAALRSELAKLLAVGSEAEGLLTRGVPETLAARAQRALGAPGVEPGTSIGSYRILEEIGEGGFGIVYRAEQHEPVRRRVALKVIKPGMDSKAVVARFDAERQALALMDHEHIARIFDGGLTDDGRPYFVMELVRGIPLTEYCDLERLDTSRRLRLVQQTCLGVQHAHQKGVIHRDLKPANILVTEQDGQPVVKIIDFGVAKAMGQQLTEQTMFTAQGQLVGTLDYMSPEQVAGGALDIDTRSDVYSLGALLYELLTGHPPFELGRRGLDEKLRTIREDEPSKPSTRVTTLGDESDAAATRRKTDIKSLTRRLRADLDWITMKALEKDRNRRYATASDLAADIERHLAGEPVLASPPSATYRLRKFVRKNRALTSSVVAVAAVVLVAFVVTLQAKREAVAREVLATASAEEARREHNNVLRLSAFQELADLKEEADALWPVEPRRRGEYEAWLARAQALIDGLESSPGRSEPSFHEQLEEIRSRALPISAEEREAAQRAHPSYADVPRLEARIAALRHARDVRRGRAQPAVFALDREEVPDHTYMLNSWARQLAGPDRAVFGREAEGLALARYAYECAEPSRKAMLHDTLAWALFANGLDAEALAMSRESLEFTKARNRGVYETYVARVEEAVQRANSEEADAEIAAVVAELDTLRDEIASQRTYTFAEEHDRWWHAQLEALVGEIEALADGATGLVEGTSPETGWGIAVRLAWAGYVDERTVSGAKARRAWAEAIASIGDPEECPQYGGLQLAPQVGLLPIGRDPDSGLWEFAHVVSGSVPERDAEGRIVVTEGTGIVLVLIPPGRTGRHGWYEISPFFLSKYEMTQGQWLHFTGENAALYHPDSPLGSENGHDLRHPVEQVSWYDCVKVLGRLGLQLPTNDQWICGTRGGTTGQWWTGKEKESIADAANVMDRSARRIGSSSWQYEDWTDGYASHAPVGMFRANPFGLHDVYGNVWEWCWDGYEQGYISRAAADPVRDPADLPTRVLRGGSCMEVAASCSSTRRRSESPDHVRGSLGVRPARGIDG